MDSCWRSISGLTATVDAETASALIAPAPEHLFEVYEISTAVNRTANDTPALIEPLRSQPLPTAAPASRRKKIEDDGQTSLF
jgi:hypothetical protein